MTMRSVVEQARLLVKDGWIAEVMEWIGEESCWLRSVVIGSVWGLSWEDARGRAAAALRPRTRGYWREYWFVLGLQRCWSQMV
jgi:hypothetical protein